MIGNFNVIQGLVLSGDERSFSKIIVAVMITITIIQKWNVAQEKEWCAEFICTGLLCIQGPTFQQESLPILFFLTLFLNVFYNLYYRMPI